MPLFTGNFKMFCKAQGLILLFLLACNTQTKKATETAVANNETCGSKLSLSQKISIDYAVQQDYADDGLVNGSWNANGQLPDGVMVHNAGASVTDDYADDHKINGSVVPKSLQSDRDDLIADAKDGKIDGVYCR